MVIEETISEIYSNTESQEQRISKLAVASMVFGILGPFASGAMWILSFNSLFAIRSPHIMVLFSCGFAWMLGLVLGQRSLEQIRNSAGQLVGREYAIVGIVLSTTWMLLVFVSLLLPALYSVNS